VGSARWVFIVIPFPFIILFIFYPNGENKSILVLPAATGLNNTINKHPAKVNLDIKQEALCFSGIFPEWKNFSALQNEN
jgi:hypothetical protein